MTPPTTITTPADLNRLAARMAAAGILAGHGVASEIVCLAGLPFQIILRPGPQNQIQLVTAGRGYHWPEDWRADLVAAFCVPEGTVMQFDLIRQHHVIKWTWEAEVAEVGQMSFAGMEESKSSYYERG